MLGQVRSTQLRQARRRPDEEALRSDVVKLAGRYGRYGYRRVTARLRAEGWPVNHKRARTTAGRGGCAQAVLPFVDRAERAGWRPFVVTTASAYDAGPSGPVS